MSKVENFKEQVSYKDWEKHESRVEIGVDIILKLLSDYKVKATFFALGWIAEKSPELIKRIAHEGHEIGSHGYLHELIYNQTPDTFRKDLIKSLKVLEEITGQKIESYRAPSFSITQESLWALDVLLECGIKYDSSIFPIRHHRYGIHNAKRFPHIIRRKGEQTLTEFPISTIQIIGKRIPFSGGGYFRLLPVCIAKTMAKRLNQQGYPLNMYLHPWEFDINQPRIKADIVSSFRHYFNIRITEEKLRYCLDCFEVGPLKEVAPQCVITQKKVTSRIASEFHEKKKSITISQKPELSIVIPIFNEEECVEKLLAKVKESVDALGRSYEIIVIDDGSTDNTYKILHEQKDYYKVLKVIRFRRNCGQTPAMVAGFDHARGDIIITMDGDLQNDPADIIKLLDKMKEGYEVVSGWRYKRKDKLLTRKIPSMIANRLISILTGVRLHDYGCSLKAYKAECIRSVNAYAEMHRFFPAVASITGARTAEIPVNHYARTLGKSKYGLLRTFKVFSDLFTIFMITKFSSKPSIFFGFSSLPFFIAGLLSLIFYLFDHFVRGHNFIVLPGMILMLFMIGGHFIILSLISAMVLSKGDYRPAQMSQLTAEIIS